MSEKTRRKKDGHDKSHERQAMRSGDEFQERAAHEEREEHERRTSKDQQDIVHYKSGSNNDRTQVGPR